jgi:hypothetical protein
MPGFDGASLGREYLSECAVRPYLTRANVEALKSEKGVIMKAALVVTWSAPVPGREKKGLEYFRDVNDFFAKLAVEGKCTEPEFFVGPRDYKIWFVKGEYETLVGLLGLPKVQEFIFATSLTTQDFQYFIAPIGTDEYLKAYEEVGAKLGYM